MSNIINKKEELLIFNDFISKDISKDNVEEILKELLPNKDGELLIKYRVMEKGIKTAEFIPSIRSINVSLNRVNEWLERNTNDFLKKSRLCNPIILKDYLFIFMLAHEIEHSYQYLMGEGTIESPNDMLQNAYKGIFDLFVPKSYIIPRPVSKVRKSISLFLYKLNQNFYLLERNANIESMDLVIQLALYNNREDIFKLFAEMKEVYSKCGYLNSCMGSIEETYYKTLMHNKYKKIYQDVDLTEEEKVRYGFSISEETRNKILTK